jgi:hypothetical protein
MKSLARVLGGFTHTPPLRPGAPPAFDENAFRIARGTLSQFPVRRSGRVVDCGGLENR